MLTPARSGQVTFLPNPWQTTQPLVENSFSPVAARAASTGDFPARGPASYLDSASTAVVSAGAGGGVGVAAGAGDEVAGGDCDAWLLSDPPPHPNAVAMV